jgi:glycosyltransferase involved in cell wall biosynthesis
MRIRMFMPGLKPDSLGWQVYQDLGDAIRAQGHDFRLLTVGTSDQDSEGDAVRLEESRLSSRLGRLTSFAFKTRSLLPAATALRGYLARCGDEAEILHVEDAYPNGAAAAMAAATSGWRGKLVINPMGEDILVVEQARYGFRRYALPRALVSWVLRRADAVRCSSALVERVVTSIGIRGETRIIPICVTNATIGAADEAADERGRRREAARAAVDSRFSTQGSPLIMAMGRLHPFKGLDVLVAALTELPEAKLLIVGPSLSLASFGDYAGYLRDRAEALGVSERVSFAGPVAPPGNLEMLAAADVVAIPSHLESHNKVAIEAAAVGTPFVVTNTTGISAAVPETGVGIVVSPGNPGAMAWGLGEILNSRWTHDPEAAADFVRRYAPKQIASELVLLYESVSLNQRET